MDKPVRKILAVETKDGNPLDVLDGNAVTMALGWMAGGNDDLEDAALAIAQDERACDELAHFLNAMLGKRQ